MQKSGVSRGFTLIELMVVITIIGLLASTILAALNTSRISARDSQRIQEARQFVNALEIYRNQNGRYPCSGGSLLCAAGSVGGAAAAVVKSTSTPTGMAASVRTTLNMNPNNDSVAPEAIVYRVGSASGDNNGTLITTYTILVYQERLTSWCEINVGGAGHSAYSFTACPISSL